MKEKDLTELAHDLGAAIGEALPIIAANPPTDAASAKRCADALHELHMRRMAHRTSPAATAFLAALGSAIERSH